MMVQYTFRSWGRWIGTGLTAFALACSAGVSADDQIQAHLAAGEFGQAFQLAQQLNGAEQDAALQQVAQAQAAAGEGTAARRTLGLMQDRKAAATERHQLGGGAQADFTALIALIESETSGPWDADEPGTGTMSQFDAGVTVDPQGVLSRRSKEELTGRLAALGVDARTANLNEDMSRHSDLRMVSLTRLEAEVSRRLPGSLATPWHHIRASPFRRHFTSGGRTRRRSSMKAARWVVRPRSHSVSSGRARL